MGQPQNDDSDYELDRDSFFQKNQSQQPMACEQVNCYPNFQPSFNQNLQQSECINNLNTNQTIDSVNYLPQTQMQAQSSFSSQRLFSVQINTNQPMMQRFEGVHSNQSGLNEQDQNKIFNQFHEHQINSQTTINDIEKNSFNSKTQHTLFENAYHLKRDNPN